MFIYELYISDRTEPPALTDNGNFRNILVTLCLTYINEIYMTDNIGCPIKMTTFCS